MSTVGVKVLSAAPRLALLREDMKTTISRTAASDAPTLQRSAAAAAPDKCVHVECQRTLRLE